MAAFAATLCAVACVPTAAPAGPTQATLAVCSATSLSEPAPSAAALGVPLPELGAIACMPAATIAALPAELGTATCMPVPAAGAAAAAAGAAPALPSKHGAATSAPVLDLVAAAAGCATDAVSRQRPTSVVPAVSCVRGARASCACCCASCSCCRKRGCWCSLACTACSCCSVASRSDWSTPCVVSTPAPPPRLSSRIFCSSLCDSWDTCSGHAPAAGVLLPAHTKPAPTVSTPWGSVPQVARLACAASPAPVATATWTLAAPQLLLLLLRCA